MDSNDVRQEINIGLRGALSNKFKPPQDNYAMLMLTNLPSPNSAYNCSPAKTGYVCWCQNHLCKFIGDNYALKFVHMSKIFSSKTTQYSETSLMCTVKLLTSIVRPPRSLIQPLCVRSPLYYSHLVFFYDL